MTPGQTLALEQLGEVAAESRGRFETVSFIEPAPGGWARPEVSIACADLPSAPTGLRLRARERLTLWIPPGFPFEPPSVFTSHTRFAGFPHVQWKKSLCLYQSSATEWNPSDGMFGFLTRLEAWLRAAALDQLDPVGGPLHPPVTYYSIDPDVPMVVVRADAPAVSDHAWFGFAGLQTVSAGRVDLVHWMGQPPQGHDDQLAAAILLSRPLPFEFPGTVAGLLREMAAQGVPEDLVLRVLTIVGQGVAKDAPLYVVVGTPMRGTRAGALRQHLAVWRVSPTDAWALRLALPVQAVDDELGNALGAIIRDWAATAKVAWCQVREDRPEIVTPRDQGSPMAWFRNRAVTLWGCGALGGLIAEFLVRAGVGRLVIRDDGYVAPGLVARQLYGDGDIGKLKVNSLADRLRRIRAGVVIETCSSDVLDEPLTSKDWTDGAEVVIDATASRAVLQKAELRWRDTPAERRVPLVSLVVGHRAERGFAVISKPPHSGGPVDVERRTKLDACREPGCCPFVDDFWREHPVFQPEPGCSESTFVGSATDVAALAGTMLNLCAVDLADQSEQTATAHFVTQPHVVLANGHWPNVSWRWEPDRTFEDPYSGYEIRLAPRAWREIEAGVARVGRVRNRNVETGGVLLGERSDILRVVWVSEACGPPPDSQASRHGFVLGTAGVAEWVAEAGCRSLGSLACVGVWHSHPGSEPFPSTTDVEAMARIVFERERPAPQSLLLIVGRHEPKTIGVTVVARRALEGATGFRVLDLPVREHPVTQPPRPRPGVGLALSGGGARAMAFHLGCLRALKDRGLLERLDVISAVSGGAVIGALYAYGREDFAAFDARMVSILRTGLLGSIMRSAFLSRRLVQGVGTLATAGSAALGADALRILLSGARRAAGLSPQHRALKGIERIQPPFRRWVSRTSAFEDALRRRLFGDQRLMDARRGDVGLVINACELRTGAAFRFGSRETGSWRLGRLVDNDLHVAEAVAASAAYPAFLPALDRSYRFVDRAGQVREERVILTDGGIYDNLGVTCLEPGLSSDFSYNAYAPQYIISCDAGSGLFRENVRPFWWPARMVRAVDAIFRKTQNAAQARLHAHRADRRLRGFVLSYLGQQDSKLPFRPADLVPREVVVGYPTDFSAMDVGDITRLAARGEQLTRLLVGHYLPEL